MFEELGYFVWDNVMDLVYNLMWTLPVVLLMYIDFEMGELVPVVTVDDVVDARHSQGGTDRVALIKIDVQGCAAHRLCRSRASRLASDHAFFGTPSQARAGRVAWIGAYPRA